MANKDHLNVLSDGPSAWNNWRKENPSIVPDLRDTNFTNIGPRGLANLVFGSSYNHNLIGYDFSYSDFSGSNLSLLYLNELILKGANFTRCNLRSQHIINTNLSDCIFDETDFSYSRIENTYLTNSHFSKTNLELSTFIRSDLSNTKLSECLAYGISIWDCPTKNSTQQDIIITQRDDITFTVDNIKIAQFIYLLTKSHEIRDAIESITSKGVLILGRFSDKTRKHILDELRKALRSLNFLPIVFDFEKPQNKDYSETIQTLASICMFVIADITDPRSTPLELELLVKNHKIPFITIIDKISGQTSFAMFEDLQKSFHWVLEPMKYSSHEALLKLENIQKYIISSPELIKIHKNS